MRVVLSIPLAILLCAVRLGFASHADILVLENGDRLTGEVLREEDGHVVFRSAMLGEVRVPAEGVTIVTTNSNEPLTAVAPELVRPVELNSPQTARLVSPAPSLPPARSERSETAWKRQIELGLSSQGGLRDQNTMSMRVEAARTNETGSLRLELSHHYGKTDGVLVSDTTSATAALTRNLSDDFFVRTATRYDRDPVVGLDRDVEQSLGLGYTVFAQPSLSLSVGGGAAVRNRATTETEAEWDGLVDAFGRLKCVFTDRLSLSQDLSLSASPDSREDYRVKSQTALVNQLTEMLRMTVRYEFEYLGSALTAVPTRQRLVTAIGCSF